MNCLVLSRVDENGCKVYLTIHGPFRGEWTTIFGVECLSDNAVSDHFLNDVHLEFPGSVVEHYRVSNTGVVYDN